MTEFDFLSVLLSIMLGLAATEILQGLRQCLLARRRIVFYWPVLLFAFLYLLIVAQVWWTMFGLRGRTDWSFGDFGIVLLETILVYMQAGLIFPEFSGATVNLKTHYYEQHRWFFGLLALTLIVSICKDLMLAGHLPSKPNIVFHATFFTGALLAASIRGELFHKFFAVFSVVAFTLYIVTLFARLH